LESTTPSLESKTTLKTTEASGTRLPGWKVAPPRNPANPFGFGFAFNSDEHDNGAKTVYGQTSNSEAKYPHKIAARRATARFLSRK